MKQVVLIRHGQSLAQSGLHQGLHRKDPSLLDCFLSPKGIQQAIDLGSKNEILEEYNFDLICTSPLTRALATTCLFLFGHSTRRRRRHPTHGNDYEEYFPPVIARVEISEAGKNLPENQGRRVPVIQRELKKKMSLAVGSFSTDHKSSSSSSSNNDISVSDCVDQIDFTMLPESWPEVDYRSGDGTRLENFKQWLLRSRKEMTIAVICHYNVIKWLLGNAIDRVPNCVPIECVLTHDGQLILKSDVSKHDA